MSEIAIRVEGLSKRYRIGARQEAYRTLRDTVTEAVQVPFRRLSAVARGESSRVCDETIWALRDVSFEVKRGEVLGIIGRNGAGKTTLLKILSRITEPTEGRAIIKGRVGSLLEVGTGFHPELTGRENIYLNGAILGMTKAEIDQKFDEIVDFSGVEKFIDIPVKHYSSGMHVRLAFSVAAHLDPEILLIDEVLAVGDASFQKKCLGKMERVAHEGRTVVFVSHNMAAIQGLCHEAVLLEEGCLSNRGAVSDVVAAYLTRADGLAKRDIATRTDRRGTGHFRFTSVTIVDETGRAVDVASTGQTIEVRVTYESRGQLSWHSLKVSIGFRDHHRQFLFNCPSDVLAPRECKIAPEGTLVCTIPRFPLLQGSYRFDIFSSVNGEVSDWIQNAGSVDVETGDFYGTGRVPTHNKGVLVDFDWRPQQGE